MSARYTEGMNQKALLEWYRKEKRDLPFRINRDPYRVWISEIMAQQTRIEAMLGHYERFMKTYPTIEDLANADDDELMRVWQGLGYYSRARNLKKAAAVCVSEWNGRLPEHFADLKKLPGIGEYTAGAIASICYQERVPAVDGNVIRVYSRYGWLEQDFSDPKQKKQLVLKVADDLPEASDMPDWTQALMELGAKVCTPKKASCSVCPLQVECKGAKMPDPTILPVKKASKARKIEERPVYVLAARGENGWMIHLRRRPARGLLAGLYEFDEKLPENAEKQLDLGSYTHVFTHKEWAMKGTLVITQAEEGFIPLEKIEHEHAIPSAFMPFYERAVRRLNEETGKDGPVRSGRDSSL